MSSHSSFYQGSKRISPLKIRNPSILSSQIMPSPTGAPFNFADMPWSYGVKPGQVMEFNAVIRPSPISHGPLSPAIQSASGSPPTFGGHSLAPNFLSDVRKRKTDPDVIPVPSKQFLTEELMASHLNNLHLSSEYTAHNIRTKTASTSYFTQSDLDDFGDSSSSMDSNAATEPYHVCMSPQELEERLKKAQRIAICEEVRKLDSRAEILPQTLLERIEKPCTALMIWQPPQERLKTFLSSVSEQLDDRAAAERKVANKNNRETSSSAMTMDDEPLPDLPDYDEDLDFELDRDVANEQPIPKPVAPDTATMDIEM